MRRPAIVLYLVLVGLVSTGLAPALASAQEPEAPAAPAAPAEATPAAVAPPPDYRPTRTRSFAARLVTHVRIHANPNGRRVRVIKPWVPGTGNPVELLILGNRTAPDGTPWLRVLLPTRPNGSSGWIREDQTIVRKNPMKVRISLSRATLQVTRAGRIVYRTGVALGKPATPTPRGLFAIYQEVREPSYSPLGPWALHLTAHSNVLFEYAGGPGRVAIHGARGELWAEPGQYISHGCIRVPDPRISRVTDLVTPGTPVEIVR